MEIYSPEQRKLAFGIMDDLRRRLEHSGGNAHISIEMPPPRREPQYVDTIVKAVSAALRSRGPHDKIRLTVKTEGKSLHETLASYRSVERAEVGSDVLAIVDIYPGVGAMTFAGHVGHAEDVVKRCRTMLGRLGQLQKDSANFLVIDATREFVPDRLVEEEAARAGGPFDRHPELTGIMLSRWGVYPGWPVEDEFCESYHAFLNPSARATVPPDVMCSLTRRDMLRGS